MYGGRPTSSLADLGSTGRASINKCAADSNARLGANVFGGQPLLHRPNRWCLYCPTPDHLSRRKRPKRRRDHDRCER